MKSDKQDLLVDSGATFSPCRKYRYRLWRYWDKSKKPTITFVMNNPSTADEIDNDPTVERCEHRARMLGYGGMEVVNLFAFRSTDPDVMKSENDPVGADNNEAIIEAAKNSGRVVCAWGNHGGHMDRGAEVVKLLRKHGITPYCLTVTAEGHPGHPLYVGYDVEMKPFGGLL